MKKECCVHVQLHYLVNPTTCRRDKVNLFHMRFPPNDWGPGVRLAYFILAFCRFGGPSVVPVPPTGAATMRTLRG